MKRHQQPRQFCINTIENPWFDRTIMFLIAVNSALVLFCPWQLYPAVWARMVEEEHGSSSTCQVPTERQGEIQDHKYLLDTIQQVELAFIVAFAIEAGFKVIAMGLFWERNSYLRSGWNWLDMIEAATRSPRAAMASAPAGSPAACDEKVTATRSAASDTW